MSRHVRERLGDIHASCSAIADYLAREGTDDDIVFDAIRVRLIEIGEAVKDIDPTLLANEPSIPWTEISRMRDQLARRYFDTAHSIVRATAAHDVPELAAAVTRLLDGLPGDLGTS
ncbi:MAG: HepT-like ribonuclease domain-containing protein [Actinomycetota bacterium]